MIELRWLERHFEWDHECDGKACVEHVLQYRVLQQNRRATVVCLDHWGDWQDVPTVKAIPT